MDRPAKSYLVCATQRSGSTLLCETLRETGRAGRPLEHFQFRAATGRPPDPRDYFEGVDDPAVIELLAPSPPPRPDTTPAERWLEGVLSAGTGPGGVWGGKLMWDQVPEVEARFRELLGAGATLSDGLRELLGSPRLVFVTRGDRVDQAVSLWRAVQTQEWRDADQASALTGREALYSHAGIDHLARWLEEGDGGWRRWFQTTGVQPLTVEYERLAADPPGVTRDVLRHVGIAPDPVPDPPTSRQRDERSAQWAARYREDSG